MLSYSKIFTRIGLSSVALLALAACGGGGDSGVASPVVTPTMVNGIASKGLVKQARVLVCRIVNGVPQADASCMTTTSGNDGSFSVTLSDGFTGPVMVKVMAGAGSMMLDETTGTDIPYGMTMRAVVAALSANTTVYVTPFSEMAANAMGMTAMDADKIRQATSTVQTMMAGLGVDLSVMPMVDLKNSGADSTMMGKQANMVAQLTKVMMAAKNSNLLTDANGVACNAPGTSTSQQVTCAVSMMASVMTGPTTYDQTRATAMMGALTGQSATSSYMPVVMSNGTVAMEPADMTSLGSMQTAMQNAGMPSSTASGTVTTMMSGMH